MEEVRGYYAEHVVADLPQAGHGSDARLRRQAQRRAAAGHHGPRTERLAQPQRRRLHRPALQPLPVPQLARTAACRTASRRTRCVSWRPTPRASSGAAKTSTAVPTLRFATADVMTSESCVSCHNTHPNSPEDATGSWATFAACWRWPSPSKRPLAAAAGRRRLGGGGHRRRPAVSAGRGGAPVRVADLPAS